MSNRLVAISLLAAVGLVPAAHAQGPGAIPSYYRSLDFNLTSPSAFTEAVGGYANPSIYPMMPGGELEFYWSSFDDGVIHDPSHWGLFAGGENIGFGVNYGKVRTPEGEFSIQDYRIGLGGGTKSATMGVGYGWSGGDDDTFGRK